MSFSHVGKSGSFFTAISPVLTPTPPDSLRRSRSSDSLREQFVFPIRKSSVGQNNEGRPAPVRLPTTESEFESLPPAIRRKYFSSLERLRFAHQVASPPPQKVLPFQKSSSGPRFRVDPRTTYSHSKSGSVLKKSRKEKRASITQAHAQWYLSLPEKIRRKHFTPEEQLKLAGTCQTVILDAADEALYRLGRHSNRSLHSIADSPIREDFSPDSLRSRSASGSVDSFDLQVEPPIEENELKEITEDWFRWLEEEEEEEDDEEEEGEEEEDEEDEPASLLGADNYHANIVPDDTVPPLPPNGHVRRPSFRRGPSLEPQISAQQPCATIETVARLSRDGHERNKTSLNISNSAPKPNTKAAALTGDSEATYYQDPEARLKLRLYLGSAQKFDEALEFGFPSTDGANVEISKHERARAEKRKSGGNGAQSFLNDDYRFLFDDGDESDDSSVPEIDEPTTPSEVDFTFRPHRLPSATDSIGAEKLFTPSRKLSVDPYAHGLTSGREMTLRMTLTRPELREEESKKIEPPYLATRETTDPLVLGALPPLTEDATGTLGPFGAGADGAWKPAPRDSGLIKKIWKKMKHGAK
ncbi:MAG: hypothetical protein M1837_003071 [Sclerophora amabilis]|nr:MAG: hypothetical protein M1837_003071 [Sclerophora amabilis]